MRNFDRNRRAAAALCVAAVATVLAGCGGNKVDPDLLPTPLVDLDNPIPVERLWSARLGGSGEALDLQLRPVSDGSAVFAAGHSGEVHAFDARTGERLWVSDLDLPLSAGPGYGDELLAVGSNDGDLAVLSASDGTVLWQRNIGAEVLATPLLVGGLVVVRTVDGRLIAMDAQDSIERWSVKREVPALSLRGNSAPAVAGSRVIAGFDDGSVLAVDYRSGDLLWDVSFVPAGGRTVIDRLADVDADIRVIGEDIYVLGYQTQLGRLSATTGSIVWNVEVAGYQRPGVDWSRIYVTDDEGNVRSIDRSNGVTRWINQDLRRRKTTGAATSGRHVVVGDLDGYLHWIDYETGLIVARERVDKVPVTSPPAVLEDIVFAQTDAGALLALRLREQE